MSQPKEPEVFENWNHPPVLVCSAGSVISGAASGRQMTLDRGPHSHVRLQVFYGLTADSSCTQFVVSAESVGLNQPLLTASTNLPASGSWGVEQYEAVPASGPIVLRDLVFNRACVSGTSGSFWVPAFPLQGQHARITIGSTGNAASGDAVSAYVGFCYG